MANCQNSRLCSVAGCDRPKHAHGMCGRHYAKYRKYGDPLFVAPPRPKRLCSIEGCDKPHDAHGYCAGHHARLRKYGDPTHIPPPKPPRILKPCLVEGCSEIEHTRRYCQKHYGRLKRYGDPLHSGPRVNQAKKGEPLRYFREQLALATPDKCIEWPYGLRHGYGVIYTTGGKQWPTHRLALVLTTFQNPVDMHALHGPCHNTKCFNPHHLSWGTREKNTGSDRVRDGTSNRGTNNGHSKLCESDILCIRKDQRHRNEMALEYNVSPSLITMIISRKAWGWLEDDAV